jgi:hypothetical protein
MQEQILGYLLEIRLAYELTQQVPSDDELEQARDSLNEAAGQLLGIEGKLGRTEAVPSSDD